MEADRRHYLCPGMALGRRCQLLSYRMKMRRTSLKVVVNRLSHLAIVQAVVRRLIAGGVRHDPVGVARRRVLHAVRGGGRFCRQAVHHPSLAEVVSLTYTVGGSIWAVLPPPDDSSGTVACRHGERRRCVGGDRLVFSTVDASARL